MNNVTKESSSCMIDRNKSSWLYTWHKEIPMTQLFAFHILLSSNSYIQPNKCFTKNLSDPEELWEEKVMEDIDLNLLI